jgi:hypothetical protein
MRTGLAERAFHTFQPFRFHAMLLSSLGFPAKLGRVLEVVLLSTSLPLWGESHQRRNGARRQLQLSVLLDGVKVMLLRCKPFPFRG